MTGFLFQLSGIVEVVPFAVYILISNQCIAVLIKIILFSGNLCPACLVFSIGIYILLSAGIVYPSLFTVTRRRWGG